jgi:hypothetical protein
LILACVLFAAYYATSVAQPHEQQTTPVGVWDLKGEDEENTKWIATLVLLTGKTETMLGHIDWLGSNHSCGREHVTATYDAKTRALKRVGTSVEFSNDVVRATYRAELSPDGLLLEKGKWSDNDPTIPGRGV